MRYTRWGARSGTLCDTTPTTPLRSATQHQPHHQPQHRSLAYTIAYSPCAPRPTDPVPRGQLWPTGPIYSRYAAYI